MHEYDEWKEIIPAFPYHGLNTYTYLLSRYGTYSRLVDGNDTLLPTFDFITIQLYEGYAHAEYNITQLGLTPEEVLGDLVNRLTTGWEVDFTTDEALQYDKRDMIRIPTTQLVLGLANGWAGDGKFLLLYPDQLQRTYERLSALSLAPRGFAFWNILDEGKYDPPHNIYILMHF